MPDASPPAPEAEFLAREVQRAGLANDPQMAAVLRAFLRGELRQRDVAERMESAEKRIAAALDKDRQPVPPEAMQRAANTIAERAAWKIALAYPWAVGGALALALGVGFGAGWWTRAAQPLDTRVGAFSAEVVRALRMNDVDRAFASAKAVAAQGGGSGRWVWFWTELPPVAEAGRSGR